MIGCWGALFEISEELILTEYLSLKDLMILSSEVQPEVNKSLDVTNPPYDSKVNLVLDGQDLLRKNLTVRKAIGNHYR